MSDFRERLATITNDPTYREFNFAQQQYATAQVLPYLLQDDPQFQQFDPETKEYAVQTLLQEVRPTYENPQYEPILKQLEREFVDGDERVKRNLLTLVTSAQTESGIMSWLGENIVDPISQAMGVQAGQPGVAQGQGMLPQSMLHSPDFEKFRTYLMQQAERERQEYERVTGRRGVNAVQQAAGIGGVVGFVSDIAAWNMLAAPAHRFIQGAVEGVASRATSRAGRSLIRNIPIIAESSAEGMMGMVRENYLQHLEDPEVERSFAQSLATFGAYFAEDYLFNMLIHGIAPVSRAVFGKLFRKSPLDGPASSEELSRMLREQVGTGQVDDVMLHRAPESAQDLDIMNRETKRILANETSEVNLTPSDRLILTGAFSHTPIRRLENGTWRTWRRVDNQNVSEVLFKNFDEAETYMIDQVVRGIDKYPTEMQSSIRKFFPNIENIYNTRRVVNAAFDFDAEKAASRKNYIRATSRPYVSRAEADQLIDSVPNESFYVRAPVDNIDEIAPGTRFTKAAQEPNAVIFSQKAATPDDYRRVNEAAQRLQRRNPDLSVDEVSRSFLREEGFDSVAWSDEVLEPLYKDQVKYIADGVASKTGRIETVLGPELRKSRVANRVFAEGQTVQALKGSDVVADKRALTTALMGVTGRVDTKKARGLADLYMSRFGVDADKINVVLKSQDDLAGQSVRVRREGDGIVFELPEQIDTLGQQRRFIRQFIDESERIGKEVATPGLNIRKRRGSSYEKEYAKMSSRYIAPDGIDQRKWLSSIVDDKLEGTVQTTADGIQVKLPGNDTPLTFKTTDEALDHVLLSTIDESTLRHELSRRGLVLRKTGSEEEGFKFIVRGGSTTIETDSLRDVMRRLDFRPKLDSRYLPDLIEVNRDTVRFAHRTGQFTTSKKQALQFIEKFEHKDEMQALSFKKITENGSMARDPYGRFVVNVPSMGIWEEFSNAATARRFLTKELNGWDALRDQFRKKGLEVVRRDGAFYVLGDGHRGMAKSREDLARIARSFPDPQGAPNLLDDIDPSIHSTIDPVIRNSDLELYRVNPPAPGSPWSSVGMDMPLDFSYQAQQFSALKNTIMERIGKVTGNADLMRNYRGTEDAVRLSDSRSNQFRKILNGIFRPDGKHMMSSKSRRKVFHYIGAKTEPAEVAARVGSGDVVPEPDEVIRRMFGEEMTDAERLAANQLDEFFVRMADEFGIDSKKLIYGYMPRVRDYAATGNATYINEHLTAREINAEVWKGEAHIPREMKWWAQEDRVNELLDFAADEDAYSVTLRYFNQGFKKKYIGPWIDRTREFMRANPNMDVSIRLALTEYVDKVMGTFTTTGERLMRRVGEELGRKLSRAPWNRKKLRSGEMGEADFVREGGDLLNKLMSLNYLTNMAFRPWLALRNTFQIFTTLGVRYDPKMVFKAVSELNKRGDDFYNMLRRVGVITEHVPTSVAISQSERGIAKITRKGLGMFKNSDEYTRAVAFMTAKLHYDEAVDALRAGTIKTRAEFLDLSGLNRVSGDLHDEVWDLTQRGINGADDTLLQEATYIYGARVTEATMFPYRSSQAPRMNNGVIGRLFGQYGTYPAGYRANLGQTFTTGTAADKILSATRLATNTAAILGGLSLIGIEASHNFLPWLQAPFTGGPMYQLANDVLASMGSGYEADQARARVRSAVSPVRGTQDGIQVQYPGLAPGSMQMRYLKKAAEAAEKGDLWRAFLALTTAPVRQDDPTIFW